MKHVTTIQPNCFIYPTNRYDLLLPKHGSMGISIKLLRETLTTMRSEPFFKQNLLTGST